MYRSAYTSLMLMLILGCGGNEAGQPYVPQQTVDGIAKAVKPTKRASAAQVQDFGGCPPGTFAYDGWSGEYPGPILQINQPINVSARSIVCDLKPSLPCTVKPGLYHPWSEISEATFKTVGKVQRFMTLKKVKFWGVTVPKGTEVIEQFYAAEGQCGLVINGKSFQDMCVSGGDRTDEFQELPQASPGFENQQYLGVECAEGHKGWVHINQALLAIPVVQEGEILDYGEVGPSALPNGQPSPLDKWASRRTNKTHDLSIAESEGPFWAISIQAGGTESSSRRKVDELRAAGHPAHMAWLGRYGSAKYKSLWFVYVGPYAYGDQDRVRAVLSEIRSTVDPKAYAVTLGRAGQREQMK